MVKKFIASFIATLFLLGCSVDLVDYPGDANQYIAELQADHAGDVTDFLQSYQNEVSRLVAFDRVDLLEALHGADPNYLQANPSDTRFAISKAFWFDKRPVLATLGRHNANFAQSDLLVEAISRYDRQMYNKETADNPFLREGTYRPEVADDLLNDIGRIIDLGVAFFVVPNTERVNKAVWSNSSLNHDYGLTYDSSYFTSVGLPGALAYSEAAGLSELTELLRSKNVTASGLSARQMSLSTNYGRSFRLATGQDQSESSTDWSRVIAGAAVIAGAGVIAETGDTEAMAELFARTAPVFGGQAPAVNTGQSSGLPISGQSTPANGSPNTASASAASAGEIMFDYTCPNTGWQKSLPIPASSNPQCLAAIKEMVVTQTCNLIDEMDAAFSNYQRQCAAEIYQ